MAVATVFRYVVLGLLRYGVPRHGYALMKEYRNRSGVQVSTGNFYRELQRLVAEGLVRTAANPPDADPRRAPYEVTETGAMAFDAWLAASNDSVNVEHEDELSSRMLFVGDTDPGLARQVIDRWQEALWIKGKVLERSREESLARTAASGSGRPNPLTLLLGRRLKHVAADLDFLEEFRTTYGGWAADKETNATDRSRPAPPVRTLSRRARDIRSAHRR